MSSIATASTIACPALFEAGQSLPLRVMASGKCTFVGKGDGPFLTTSCGCPAGRFGLDDDNKLTGNCEKCTHSISDHETSRSPAPPVPLAITQVPRLTGPKYCQRTETVTKLLQLSETFPVVHIRGTPATGKSILAELLKDALERQGTSVIFRTKWDPLVSANEHRVAVESAFYEQVAKESLYPGFFPNGVLIVDEAQGTYSDVLFWDVFLKYLSTRELMNNRVRVFLFCCYGSPSTGADRDEAMTPHRLAEEQRVTLTPQSLPGSPQIGLFYDEREFLEVISRIEGEYQECFRLTDDAKSYLRMLTSGHAGCLWSLINCIYNAHRSSMKHHEGFEVTKAHFIQFLKDESSAFEHLLKSDLGRAFYDENISSFTIPAANILYEIAEKGNLPWDPKQDGMQTCYRRGWVQRLALNEKLDPAVKEVVVLPTLLHEIQVKHLIGKQNNPLPDQFTNLRQLCIETLRKFSSVNLRNSSTGKKLSAAGKARPVEAAYQDEFYLRFSKVVGRGVPICTEWSRTTSGRVDFWIPEKRWAIELLRDHDRLQGHLSRFKSGGQYHAWIEGDSVLDWIVINCTTTRPTQKYDERKLLHAVFENEFRELRLFNSQLELLGSPYVLTN